MIGPKGVNIKRIKSESGASAQLDVNYSEEDRDRVFRLVGTSEQLKKALHIMKEVTGEIDVHIFLQPFLF